MKKKTFLGFQSVGIMTLGSGKWQLCILQFNTLHTKIRIKMTINRLFTFLDPTHFYTF